MNMMNYPTLHLTQIKVNKQCFHCCSSTSQSHARIFTKQYNSHFKLGVTRVPAHRQRPHLSSIVVLISPGVGWLVGWLVGWFMVLNVTFKTFSAMLWWSVLFVEKKGVPGENYRLVASHWQT